MTGKQLILPRLPLVLKSWVDAKDIPDKTFIDIPQPKIVAEYNTNMGGVDHIEMLLELYRIDIRSNKWYMRIFFWCLGVAVTNNWLLCRRHQSQRGKKDELSLLAFQSQIAFGLR